MAKEFFQKKNIEYEEVDVSADANAREELIQKSGQLAVPVIAIDDEIVVGFDQARIEALL